MIELRIMTGTLKYLSWLMGVILLCTISCSDKEKEDTPPGETERTEEEVEMHFLTPAQTYSVTDPGGITERTIKELDVLVFKNDEYQYRRQAYLSAGTYRTTLRVDNGLTLYFAVNARSVVESCPEIVEGKSWDNDIQPALILNNPTSLIGSDSIPMWGIKENVNIVPAVVNQIEGIFLLRAVASADIYNSEEDFVLKEAYIYFAPDKGYLAPTSSNYVASDKSVIVPESPADMANLTQSVGFQEATGGNIIYKLYLYENDAPTDVIGPKRFSRLVLGGSYLDGPVTYYPVDFAEDGNNTILQATRNFKYLVNISAVNGPGYEDPDIASEEFDSRMTVNVIDWNMKEDHELVFDGPHYISLESKYVYLFKPAGSKNTLSMTTNIETGKIQMEFMDSGNGAMVEVDNLTIQNDRFKVEILLDSNEEIYALRFTALQEYDPDVKSHNFQDVRLYSNRMEFVITIEQLDESPNEWIDGGNKETTIGEEEED
ncbi:MAG: hypothetical protein LUG51_16795 [Tannerellaceae bacterium]|nr:hypothetical protein [Tannerellaceae bacterium]